MRERTGQSWALTHWDTAFLTALSHAPSQNTPTPRTLLADDELGPVLHSDDSRHIDYSNIE